MSNKEYDEVITLARDKNLNLSACPTCRVTKQELAPGVWDWPASQYKLEGVFYPCDCELQDNLRRHYLLAGIPLDYWTLSEDDFFGDSKALEAAQDYMDKWVDCKWHGLGIAFHSTLQGTGKTMLASLIGKHLIKQNERVYFTSFRDIFIPRDMPYDERDAKIRRLRNVPVLVLDEVGTAISDPQYAFFSTELEDLIRHRTGGNAVTIVTTNLTERELDKEYPRMFSLLSAKQKHVTVSGHDVRRAGEIDLLRQELIANSEAKPIT